MATTLTYYSDRIGAWFEITEEKGCKVLITGATGLLGRALVSTFQDKGWSVTGVGFSRASKYGLTKLDLTKRDEVTKFVTALKPQVIIHAAAERNVDTAAKNEEKTLGINEAATEHLAKLAKDLNSFFLYISTDYVFDGTKPPYRPDSIPNPINVYGKSKLLGEKAVRKNLSDKYCILRIPVLFGIVEKDNIAESSVTALAELVRMGASCKIDNWSVRYPTFTEDVAYACAQICQIGLTSNFSGIYHFSGEESFTKYEQALEIGKLWKKKTDSFVPDDTPSRADAPDARPKNTKLDCQSSKVLGISKTTKFSVALAKVLGALDPKK